MTAGHGNSARHRRGSTQPGRATARPNTLRRGDLGRAGYDLVVKCLRVRLPIIASVSAPSALAFDLCEAAGATLVGFARGERHEVYCGAERLV